MSSLQDKYELIVGLEIHAQLSTSSKIYASDSAEFGGSPNTHVSPLSLGHPGTLPMLNEKAVRYAIKMGLATNCKIRSENQFARKNYFYADLPKGYQITQHTTPICYEGFIFIKTKDLETKRIGITRIHLEEDAGKSMHDQDLVDSLIDLNRAGVPLIEIVSEPDIRSAEQAGLYLTEIRKLLRYLDICDGNMEEGSMRCDANISVRLSGQETLGNRCEVKNLNSIRNVQRAIEYEALRQIEVLEAGGFIDQNTLNFDAVTGRTSVLRSKEMSNDYRYFPEPDIPPLVLTAEFINAVKADMLVLPNELQKKFIEEYNLPEQDALTLIDHRDIAFYFIEVCKFSKSPKMVYNWLMGPIKSYLNEHALQIAAFSLKPAQLAALIHMVESGLINHSVAAQQLFPLMLANAEAGANPEQDPHRLAEDHGWLIDSNAEQLEDLIKRAIEKYPDKVLDFQQGKKGLTGLFMGEVMKLSGGKVDPKLANKLLVDTLEKYKI